MKLILVALGLLVASTAALFFLSSGTQIQVNPPLQAIGEITEVPLQLTNPHGIRSVAARIDQDGKQYPLPAKTFPSHWPGVLQHESPANVTIDAGKAKAPQVHDGKAKVTIEVVANDFRGKKDSVTYDVDVITQPPQVASDNVNHEIIQGGSGLVTFTPSGYVTESGVEIDRYKFRSFSRPEHPGERFSFFAFPWDVPANVRPIVYAANPAGAKTTDPFRAHVKEHRFHSSRINLTDDFMQKVVADIDPQKKIQGDLVTRFVHINRDIRKENQKTLYDLRLKTEDAMLWKGPFQKPYLKIEAYFADRRSYIYKGQVIDEETHLGYDMADLPHMEIVALNSGKVLYAGRLGIYGNCIVIDHGYGIQSIFGHLSRLDVKPGDRVEKGVRIGLSGQTGMAGGDHLHFSMQVDGVQVNPSEWWSEKWMNGRVIGKL